MVDGAIHAPEHDAVTNVDHGVDEETEEDVNEVEGLVVERGVNDKKDGTCTGPGASDTARHLHRGASRRTVHEIAHGPRRGPTVAGVDEQPEEDRHEARARQRDCVQGCTMYSGTRSVEAGSGENCV